MKEVLTSQRSVCIADTSLRPEWAGEHHGDAERSWLGVPLQAGGSAFGLYTLVKVHFAKEEEVYLPILDARLTPDEARSLFEVMEQAAGAAKSALVH